MSASHYRTSKVFQQQGIFLSRLGRLLREGFSMRESLLFLESLGKGEWKERTLSIRGEIEQGASLGEALENQGFPDYTCTRLFFALHHGQFHQAVSDSGRQLIRQAEKRRKLHAVMQYPLMLLIFVGVMLFTMRYVLIPHIEQIASFQSGEMSLSTWLIVKSVYHSPVILLFCALLAGVGLGVWRGQNKKHSPVDRLNRLMRWDIGGLLELYWSQFFAHEWGLLIKGSCSLREVVVIMQGKQSSQLSKNAGHMIEEELLHGADFSDSLAQFAFLSREVREVVRQGERSGKLGYELELYAQHCEEDFDRKVEQLMNWIQPVVFAGVALVIVAIYAALLLPTFSIMDTL
nr:competence type IV pilus assembly protein ComGB [Alkalibacterium sp. AK22]